MLTRRTLLIVAVSMLASACAPAEAGLRGVGTVARPTQTPAPAPTVQPTANLPLPTPLPTLVLPDEPIVQFDAIPAAATPGDSLAAEARVIPVTPTGATNAPQYPPRRLVVPSIGVDSKIIVLGTKLNRNGDIVWETAPFAVGYHRGTGAPGQIGNMVLSGHISSPSEGAIFRNLPNLGVGEAVIVFTDERSYLYRVEETRVVDPSEVSVMDATSVPIATLITCVPDGVYTQRLVVSARLV